jgi:outer membrane immunogenic protein
VEPAYNWSGFYLGGNVGYGFGRVNNDSSSSLVFPSVFGPPFDSGVTVPFASSTRTPLDGIIGGGQIGFNAQFNRLVVGFEADFQGSDQKRNTSSSTAFGASNGLAFPTTTDVIGTQTESLSTRLDWFGTARGRIGYATSDMLWYGTAGLAYGHFNVSGTQTNVGTVSNFFTPSAFANTGSFSISQNRTGWSAGGGVEGAAWGPGWTWKVEYLHLDFGRLNYSFTTVGTLPSTVTRSVRFTDDIIRVGLNYRLNWGGGGVVARY